MRKVVKILLIFLFIIGAMSLYVTYQKTMVKSDYEVINASEVEE